MAQKTLQYLVFAMLLATAPAAFGYPEAPDDPIYFYTRTIQHEFDKCWEPPDKAAVITVHVRLNRDGSLASAELAGSKDRYDSDATFQASADAAIRAVKKCTPLKGLFPEDYGNWKEMDFTFY